MDRSDRWNLLRDVFETPMSDSDVDAYLARALDQRYWERLNPALSIGRDRAPADLEAFALDPSHIDAERRRYEREGYFRTASVVRADVLRRMQVAIEAVRAERWPPVFAFVYDEFWWVLRTPSLVALLSALLGEGCRQNCLVWTFYIASARGARGWSPHVDASGAKPRLTLWIPVTDATVENGCMYVIPGDRLVDDLRRPYTELANVSKDQLNRLLQCTQALPAAAGSYLGWNHDLVHWGSVSNGNGEPRISLGLEFIGPEVTPVPGESPVLDPLAPPPSFAARLNAIGKSLFVYQRYEPAHKRFTELARLLFETSPA